MIALAQTCRLPQNKYDIEAVEYLIQAGPTIWAPHASELLEWYQDANWPIAKAIQRLIKTAPNHFIVPIRKVLQGNDEEWQHNCVLLVGAMPPAFIDCLRPDLEVFLSQVSQSAELDWQFQTAIETVLGRMTT